MNRDMHDDDLLVEALDGRLSDDELRSLSDRLKEEPALARRMIELARDESLLQEILSESKAGIPVAGRRAGRQGARPSRSTERPVPKIRWGVWMSVAACLAIIIGALVHNHRQVGRFEETFIAHIESTVPGVTILRGNGSVSAVVDMGILADDVIRTAGGQQATIVYRGENTRVKVGENTAIEIDGVEQGKRLRLEMGSIDASVDPQPADRPMTVATPHALCEVKGTRFILAAGTTMTRLDVLEGKVLFTRLAERDSVLVAAGGSAVAGKAVGAAVRYVDGDVIHEDDFENGLGKWMVTGNYHYPDGRVEHREIIETLSPREYVVIAEVERDGGKTRVAQFQGERFQDYAIHFGLRPRDCWQITSPVSWEFDLFVTTKGGGLPQNTVTGILWSRKDVGRWVHWRNEYVPTADSGGEAPWVVRAYRDGRRMKESPAAGDSVLGAVAGLGAVMMIDNSVIRKMVPETGDDMKK